MSAPGLPPPRWSTVAAAAIARSWLRARGARRPCWERRPYFMSVHPFSGVRIISWVRLRMAHGIEALGCSALSSADAWCRPGGLHCFAHHGQRGAFLVRGHRRRWQGQSTRKDLLRGPANGRSKKWDAGEAGSFAGAGRDEPVNDSSASPTLVFRDDAGVFFRGLLQIRGEVVDRELGGCGEGLGRVNQQFADPQLPRLSRRRRPPVQSSSRPGVVLRRRDFRIASGDRPAR